MNTIREIMQQGGPVMYPLMILSVLLYERCLNLYLLVRHLRRNVLRAIAENHVEVHLVRTWQEDLRRTFDHQQIIIGALVAAAPLLGLLGTVMGMVSTFDSISSVSRESATNGLASGISMALITTEVGLAMAIPAVIFVYYAQRQLQGVIHRLADIEADLVGAS